MEGKMEGKMPVGALFPRTAILDLRTAGLPSGSRGRAGYVLAVCAPKMGTKMTGEPRFAQ